MQTDAQWLVVVGLVVAVVVVSVTGAPGCLIEECRGGICKKPDAAGGNGGGGIGGTGGTGGTGGGSGGTGGDSGCTGHIDCTDAALAQCDTGTCVPCTDSPHCAGVADADLCEAGTCVECTVADQSACGGTETCDLLQSICVDIAPASVLNCHACSNDLQCEAGHRCIPMDFQSQLHGYYCLREPPPVCEQPFLVGINHESISGAAATGYCGIEEDLATCEAVLALVLNWQCNGTDGMCSPDGIVPDMPVPGALCDPVGMGGDRCTYACNVPAECPLGPGSTCGTGTGTPPGWCGG